MVQIILLHYIVAFTNRICSPIKLMTSRRSVQSIKHSWPGVMCLHNSFSLMQSSTHSQQMHICTHMYFFKILSHG